MLNFRDPIGDIQAALESNPDFTKCTIKDKCEFYGVEILPNDMESDLVTKLMQKLSKPQTTLTEKYIEQVCKEHNLSFNEKYMTDSSIIFQVNSQREYDIFMKYLYPFISVFVFGGLELVEKFEDTKL